MRRAALELRAGCDWECSCGRGLPRRPNASSLPVRCPTIAVFDNGLFANVPWQVLELRRWEALGDASVHSDSNLVFADGTVINSEQLYRAAVDAHKRGDRRPRLPVSGPSIRFRRH